MITGQISVGEYLESLIHREGYNQSDVARGIGVPRQLLSYVISGRRVFSVSLALKLESFFSLPEGELFKLQAQQCIRKRKQSLRKELVERLIAGNAFWSYSDIGIDTVSDEDIIEKTFEVLDMQDIDKLFELFPRKFVKKVWDERMAIQGDYLMNLNVMIAMYYFGIKEPERYLARMEKKHIRSLTRDA